MLDVLQFKAPFSNAFITPAIRCVIWQTARNLTAQHFCGRDVKNVALHTEEGKAIGNITYSNVVLQNERSAHGLHSSELQFVTRLCETGAQISVTRDKFPCPHHKVIYGEDRPSSTYSKLGATCRCIVSITPRPLYSQERGPATHWTGGLVDPTDGLDVWENTKIPCPSRQSKPCTVQPAT